MPFEEFQAAALYDPEHGFFSKGELRSTKAGDFLTSPEVSPLFGETLARFVERELERLRQAPLPPDSSSPAVLSPPGGDQPKRGRVHVGPPGGGKTPPPEAGIGGQFQLVEVGAGSGSLLRPLLEALSFEPEVWVVEASPMARQALSDLPPYPRPFGTAVLSPPEGDYSEEQPPSPLAGHSPHDAVGGETDVGPPGGRGVPRIVSSIDDLPDGLTGVILANELIDNLPVAIAVRTETGWRERWVGADGDQLVLVDAPARLEVVDWCEQFAGPCPVDGFVEVQLAAAAWLEVALSKLDGGSVVLIDYGDTAENLEPRRTEGTLRTYRAHHLGPHPLDEPGETDITVDVNFTALEMIARRRGAEVEYHRQDEFLSSFGLRERLSDLRRREFALAGDGDPLERLKIRSVKNEAETLMHPRGLGDFRVLVARIV